MNVLYFNMGIRADLLEQALICNTVKFWLVFSPRSKGQRKIYMPREIINIMSVELTKESNHTNQVLQFVTFLSYKVLKLTLFVRRFI